MSMYGTTTDCPPAVRLYPSPEGYIVMWPWDAIYCDASCNAPKTMPELAMEAKVSKPGGDVRAAQQGGQP